MTDIFKKLFVSKLSPQNGCHAPEGEILYVAPLKAKPKVPRSWHFLDARLHRKSKFGWVQERTEFTLDEFLLGLSETQPRDALDSTFISFQLAMLKVAAKLEADEVAGVDFLPRGIPPKPTLIVHKVILYDRDGPR